jgi:type 1 glutamine amidotransferase
MRTQWLVLTGLTAAALVCASVMAATKGGAKTEPAAGAAAASVNGYDPTKAGGYRAEEVKKMEAALPTEAFAKPAKARKLLVYTESKGFYHDSIPLAAVTFKAMGDKLGTWETTFSDDVTIFDSAERLAKFDGIMMDNTVGEHPNTDAGKKNFIDFVKSGKGLMGIHAAADCNHPWAEYQDMIGGEFHSHPFGRISVKNEDPDSPLMKMFDGKGFMLAEEVYTFRMLKPDRQQGYSRDRQHVLLSIDMENSGDGVKNGQHRSDNDYALAWIHKYGDGRVFYCAFGHQHDHFWNPTLLKFYLAGIQYALGDIKADAMPSAKIKSPKVVRGPSGEFKPINPR